MPVFFIFINIASGLAHYLNFTLHIIQYMIYSSRTILLNKISDPNLHLTLVDLSSFYASLKMSDDSPCIWLTARVGARSCVPAFMRPRVRSILGTGEREFFCTGTRERRMWKSRNANFVFLNLYKYMFKCLLYAGLGNFSFWKRVYRSFFC